MCIVCYYVLMELHNVQPLTFKEDNTSLRILLPRMRCCRLKHLAHSVVQAVY
jgi:hypothetical protein